MDYKRLPTLTSDGEEVEPKKGVKKKLKMNFPTLFRCKDGRVDVMEIWSDGDKWYTEWGIKGGQTQTCEREGETKNDGKVNELTPEEDALYQAFSHWNKSKKKGGYDVDLQDVENQFPLIAMSAYDVRKKENQKKGFDWEKKYILQPKIDGHRMTSGIDPKTKDLVLVSRSRNPIYHIKKIRKTLQSFHQEIPDVYLDGELFNVDYSRQQISSMVRRKNDPHPDEDNLIYYIFDCYFPHEPEKKYIKRINFLMKNIKDTDNVRVLPTYKSNGTKEDIDNYFKVCMEKKMEGMMIKTYEGLYKPGKRSMDVLKMKHELEADVPIVGFTEGTGSHKGMIIFECLTEDGQKFRSTPAWTHDKRKKAFLKGDKYIGKIGVISYFTKSDDGIYEFNVMRDIKD